MALSKSSLRGIGSSLPLDRCLQRHRGTTSSRHPRLSRATTLKKDAAMSAMLSWQVGRVTITRIVEMDLPVPARLIPQATAEALRKLAWLYPHFVSEDDT